MKKRKQHYVWGYYLQSWCTDGSLYCLRDGVIFPSSVEGVANKRDFYRLRELGAREIDLIKRIAIDPSAEHLQKLNLRWVRLFNLIFDLKKIAERRGVRDQEIYNEIDQAINNFEENFHDRIETSAIKYIGAILEGNISFLEIDDEYIDFTYFLSVQFMRTKKLQDNLLTRLGCFPNVDMKAVLKVLSHIFATNVAWSLYCERKKLTVVLLENRSSIGLITADQPVVNTYATNTLGDEPVGQLELYYPVAPEKAILIAERPEYQGVKRLPLHEEEAMSYNYHMVRNSHEQVYAASRLVLEAMR